MVEVVEESMMVGLSMECGGCLSREDGGGGGRKHDGRSEHG